MSVDPQDPGNIGGNLALEVEHGGSERIQGLPPGGANVGLADVEQHRRLEHEAVADHANVGPRAEDLPQAPEKVGAIAVELLNLLRQRDVEPLAEVGDFRL